MSVKLLIFSCPWVITYVLGAQKNRLIETVLLSTHNICFGREIRKLFFGYALLKPFFQRRGDSFLNEVCSCQRDTQLLVDWWLDNRSSMFLILCMLGNFHAFVVVSWLFFKINFFKKLFQEHYQSVKLLGSRMLVLILVQTVCKGFQQMTKVTASKERVNPQSADSRFCAQFCPFEVNIIGLSSAHSQIQKVLSEGVQLW